MRLFKSNKSQASLNISAGRSPLHSPIDSPLQSPAFPPPQSAAYAPGSGSGSAAAAAVRYDESTDPLDSQRYFSPDEQQLSTQLSSEGRSSNPTGHGYQGRPTVNIVPGHLDENNLLPSTVPLANNTEERRQKKHGKRGLFGLHSFTDNHSHTPSLTLGRSFSTKKKAAGQQQNQDGSLSQITTTQYSGEGYSSDTHEGNETSNEYIAAQAHPDPDEQYYRQQNQFESPQSQSSSHYSGQYQDEDPRQSPQQYLQHSSGQNLQQNHQQNQQQDYQQNQQQNYQHNYQQNQQQYQQQETQQNPQQVSQKPYHLRPADPSNPYIQYNSSPADRPSLDIYDPYRTIRPPSQQSLGPPSPIISVQQSNEPRPAASHVGQPIQPNQPSRSQSDAGMARGDGSNPSMRQQMAQQQGTEQSHGQYGPPQGSRQLQHSTSSMTDHGRNTPPPTRPRDEFNTQDYVSLVGRLEELQAKYSKVKKYYFEKDAQVTALQNTVANQRLSMSRTTLDDHEYTTRFNRLDGAINNLSFNIRKDWKWVPPWLAPFINKDAHNVGTKEMTAVGRACITRWVIDEILDRYFHPRLEPGLSTELKVIEKNIRSAGRHQVLGEEQREDLVVKLTSWRLTTLEGLADIMTADQGRDYEQQLTNMLMEKLTASLQMNLNEPPPPGLESGVGMIIELAIGLASSLPQESRDVCVEYYMPGSLINETYMKLEPGIPPLTNPGGHAEYLGPPDQQQGDQASTHSGDENSPGEKEGEKENNANAGAPSRADPSQGQGASGPQQQMKKDDNRKKSLFGGLVSSSKKPSQPENGSGGLAPVPNPRMASTSSATSPGAKDREAAEKMDRDRRIRFAAFVGVEVRGKGKEGGNVLVKAPCYGF